MSETVQSVALLDFISALEDPRQAGKVLFALDEIMLLVLCGVQSDAESFVEIARLEFRRGPARPHRRRDCPEHGASVHFVGSSTRRRPSNDIGLPND